MNGKINNRVEEKFPLLTEKTLNLKIDDTLGDNLTLIDKKMKKTKDISIDNILSWIKQIFIISTIPTMFLLRFKIENAWIVVCTCVYFREQSRKCIPEQVMYAHCN